MNQALRLYGHDKEPGELEQVEASQTAGAEGTG